MGIYHDFLKSINIPTEEEFNEIVKKLPSLENIDTDAFSFIPEYDCRDEMLLSLFDIAFLLDLPRYVEAIEVDYDNQTTSVDGIDDQEMLDIVNVRLTDAGWKLTNYDACKSTFSH